MVTGSMIPSSIYTPNAGVPSGTLAGIRVGWVLVALGIWLALLPPILPKPLEVLQAFPTLISEDGLLAALAKSFTTNIKALVVSAAIALPVAYLSRVPLFRPLGQFISQLRFLSPAMFFLVLLLIVKTPSKVKLAMLVLGEVFFLTTTMVNAVMNIPEESFDEARVLRMSEWVATWYVVVRGTLATALEAIRDNAAIGWGMVMMVEGFVRSEGGVGVLMLNQEKYFHFDKVYGIAIAVLVVGIAQDLALRWLRGEVCPHTRLS